MSSKGCFLTYLFLLTLSTDCVGIKNISSDYVGIQNWVFPDVTLIQTE